MTPFQALILGMVQGLTEFLPVSSSGHLVLGKKLLKVQTEMPVTFEVVVHMGTLLATLIVFWKPVWEILAFLFRDAWVSASPAGVGAEGREGGFLARGWNHPGGRLLTLVLIGTIPAGVVGVFFEDQIEAMFSSTLLVGVALCLTGLLLFLTQWTAARGEGITDVSAGKGLLVGIAQAVSITPGVSRSGSTIATGLLCGIDRETAARFSFVLSMPAIAGAVVLKAADIFEAGVQVGWMPLATGFLAALGVGYVALRILLAFVRVGRLHWFSWYCWAVGIVAIVAGLLGATGS